MRSLPSVDLSQRAARHRPIEVGGDVAHELAKLGVVVDLFVDLRQHPGIARVFERRASRFLLKEFLAALQGVL